MPPATAAAKLTDEAGAQLEESLGLIGYRLRRAQLSVFQRFAAVFDALAIRPAEYAVLVLVDDSPGRKQSEIAAALGIKRANFVALAQGLEARGLIERLNIVSDRRANALHLTPTGRSFLARARSLHDELEQEFIGRLGGPAKREQLLDLLQRLT